MLQSLRYAPAPQALKANSQREGTQITKPNKRLLLEALTAIEKNHDPQASMTYPIFLDKNYTRIADLLKYLQEITDPLELVVQEVAGAYNVFLVNPIKDRYGTGLVTIKTLFPPPENTSSRQHAFNTLGDLIEKANTCAVYSTQPDSDQMAANARALGLDSKEISD